MWDCYGLECLYNLTEWSKKMTYNTLMEKPLPNSPPIDALMMRARFNPQRNYEIYTFNTEHGLPEEDIREAFENNPQSMVDFIRKHGQKMWSDKVTDKEKRVIE
jgi:hypothetical protein